MSTGVSFWSRTAATNATADANINWAEGMAPSQVNDSARAMMASIAHYRDEIGGSFQTAGTNTAYTYSSQQGFSSLSLMDRQTFVIRFNQTCGSAPTLNIDSLGGKPIQQDGATAVTSGSVRINTIHHLTYDNSLGVFIVHNGHTLVEPGRLASSASSGAPPGWLFCDGSAISRTTFVDLFNNIGTLFGIGDGSTTFNIPDMRGRTAFGVDPGGVRLAGAATVGITGGAASVTLTTGNIPLVNFTPGGTIGGSQTFSNVLTSAGGQNVGSAATPAVNVPGSITVNGSNFSFTGTSTSIGNSSPSAVIIQPQNSIVNYIIKT